MRFNSRFWRRCRLAFRCVRLAAWMAVLAGLLIFLWCNRVGLPDFLKARLVSSLGERGVKLEFSRMRLSLIRGFVAENVCIGGAQPAASPALAARQVQLQLNYAALLHRRWQLDGLVIRNGQFTLPLSPTNALTLTNLQTELRFQAGDTWSLDHFHADFAGMHIGIFGELAHAPAARYWEWFSGGGARPGAVAAALNDFAGALRQIHFQGEPKLRLTLAGDARDIHSLTGRLDASAPGVRTPWFAARNFQAALSLTAPAAAPTNSDAAWGFWTHLRPFRLAWSAQLGELRSAQLNADAVASAGVWAAPTLAVTNLSARIGGGSLQTAATLDVPTRRVEFQGAARLNPDVLEPFLAKKIRARLAELSWSQPPKLTLAGSLRLPTWTNLAVADWGHDLAPTVRLRGELACAHAAAGRVTIDRLHTHFSYGDRIWTLPDFTVAEGQTRLSLSGELSAATENFQGLLTGQVDPAGIAACLPANQAVPGLSELKCREPLALTADLLGNLRSLETLCATGRVALTNFAICGRQLDSVAAAYFYTNRTFAISCDLTNFSAAQARTRLRLSGAADTATGKFHCRLTGQLDEATVAAMLATPQAARGLSELKCREPLLVVTDLAGNLRTLETLRANGRLALTNYAIRGVEMDSVAAAFYYTNRAVTFFAPELRRAGGAQWMKADALWLDFRRQAIWITNGLALAEPEAVTRAIGPKTAHMLAPYHFYAPPLVRVNGSVPVININNGRDAELVDLTFEILQGAPFRWARLSATNLTGTFHWFQQSLVMTNLAAQLYDGTGTGCADLDFRPVEHDCDYNFSLDITNVNLHLLAADLSTNQNHLEGRLSGAATVTNASSADWHSWNGAGHARLQDGLLWDVPMFAFMSPVLNAVSPGLGNSRAKDAAAQFLITNGVITTDSLLIDSTIMRLQYAGTVDLNRQVNARVTAQLMRNTPVIGQVLSDVLWPFSKIFECHVTGQLDDPVVKPVYIPFSKILFAPLHPLRSLEELFGPPAANAPAAK